jgi:hypothetical protein
VPENVFLSGSLYVSRKNSHNDLCDISLHSLYLSSNLIEHILCLIQGIRSIFNCFNSNVGLSMNDENSKFGVEPYSLSKSSGYYILDREPKSNMHVWKKEAIVAILS